MHREELREQIATEAARLMLRGKERDFAAARKRAARWLKKKKLHRDEVPSNQEIQVQLYALSGLMASERDPMLRAQHRHWVGQVLQWLQPNPAVWIDDRDDWQLASGAPVTIEVQGEVGELRDRLQAAGLSPQIVSDSADKSRVATIRLQGQFPCEILIHSPREAWLPPQSACSREQLQTELQREPVAPYEPADDEHPDAFAVFEMLLEPLARVLWSAPEHPEGDALYHSLQVFELGRSAHPYDEEFQLACLLHDVGYGINPRHPVLSALDALGTLITPRTRFLIEQRPVAERYLLTGECPRSLKRSEDFDDVVLLARCDREGRVAGAQVPSLEQALAEIAGLEGAWDEQD